MYKASATNEREAILRRPITGPLSLPQKVILWYLDQSAIILYDTLQRDPDRWRTYIVPEVIEASVTDDIPASLQDDL